MKQSTRLEKDGNNNKNHKICHGIHATKMEEAIRMRIIGSFSTLIDGEEEFD
jgi:hypothetical protein